ncbi:MAG: HAAS signaling domain-containing protein [Nocardioidaceae bacterium]
MNDPTIRLETRPEVSAFVEKVRARLFDLSDEEREELVGGLEADIDELVSDGGSVAELGDPRAYADELRAAAGVERRTSDEDGAGAGGFLRGRRSRRRVSERVDALLDAARRRWAELVDVPALRAIWDLLVTLRPVWWVLRAWVAMQLLDIFTQAGDMATPVPLIGGPLLGSLLWLVAIVVSVQIGRDRIWPGSGAARRTSARVVLLGLNTFAVLMTPVVLAQFPASGTYHDYVGVYDPEPGLMNQEQYVRNVYPYDSEGNPLTGVQLFDENGNPLDVATFLSEDLDGDGRTSVAYPWLNGERRLFNVFPLPEREQPAWRTETFPNAWTSANPPALPAPPLAVVPPAVLPLAEAEADSAEGTEGDAEESGDPSTETREADEPTGERAGTQRDSEKREGR